MDTFFEFLKFAGAALSGGLLSSFLANRDHRQRKWWELRVSAYQNAIESLAELLYYYDTHYDAEIESRELPKEFEEKLKANWEQAYPRIRKYADSGAFLFSDEANAALSKLLKKEHAETFFEHIDNELAKVRECLNRLVECSKTDLKLKPSWLGVFYKD